MGFIGSIADFRDQEAFRAIVQAVATAGVYVCERGASAAGFGAERGFSPDPAEVERAGEMIAAYDAAYAAGLGAVQFEGAMIDVPVVERARSVVRRALALRKR